jgi:hypothetical protein
VARQGLADRLAQAQVLRNALDLVQLNALRELGQEAPRILVASVAGRNGWLQRWVICRHPLSFRPQDPKEGAAFAAPGAEEGHPFRLRFELLQDPAGTVFRDEEVQGSGQRIPVKSTTGTARNIRIAIGVRGHGLT